MSYIGDFSQKVVYLTEGGLKSIIACCLSGKTFIANQGANNHVQITKALEILKAKGVETIVMAYDMDRRYNTDVENGYKRIITICRKLGFKTIEFSWPWHKGIDDYLLYCKKIGVDVCFPDDIGNKSIADAFC